MNHHGARDVVPGRRGKENAKGANFNRLGKTVHRHELLKLLKCIRGQIFVQIRNASGPERWRLHEYRDLRIRLPCFA